VPTARPTALVVDDEMVLRRTVQRLLERHGYQVLVASSGEVALELWRRHSAVIAVLVTDLHMPGMSGPELVARLRRERPDLPVLFLTGISLLDAPIDRALADIPVIRKPFDSAEVVNALDGVLGRSRGA
jgi:CheY-like chemotaxis protein